MLSIADLATQLKDKVSWQRTPQPLSDYQYESMIIYGIKTLLIDTGRASEYTSDTIQTISNQRFANLTITIDEEKYIMLCAEIEFFNRVKTNVNNIVGYTTDAMSVTNADKPYANLANTISDLENERRKTYYKMVSYTM